MTAFAMSGRLPAAGWAAAFSLKQPDRRAALQRERPVNSELSRRSTAAALEAAQRSFESAGDRPKAALFRRPMNDRYAIFVELRQ